jgi:hypothetical protein
LSVLVRASACPPCRCEVNGKPAPGPTNTHLSLPAAMLVCWHALRDSGRHMRNNNSPGIVRCRRHAGHWPRLCACRVCADCNASEGHPRGSGLVSVAHTSKSEVALSVPHVCRAVTHAASKHAAGFAFSSVSVGRGPQKLLGRVEHPARRFTTVHDRPRSCQRGGLHRRPILRGMV